MVEPGGRGPALDLWTGPDQVLAMGHTVNLHEAKTHLSRLVDRAAAGEEIVIARGGRPVARLVALAPIQPRRFGLCAGQPYRIADDFDELPPDAAAAFEGRREVP